MNIKKNLFAGFRRYAAVIAGIVICASIFTPARTSAQNPGLGGAKTTPAIPISLEDVPTRRMSEYVVATGEVVRDLLLTGELNAASFIGINAPRSQNNFGNSITYLAEEGAYIRAGELIVEFDNTNLMNQRADAELTLETAKLNVAKRKLDLESSRANLLNTISQQEATVKKAKLDASIDQSLLSENVYERNQLNLTRAQLNLDKARGELDNFDKNYDSEMTLVEIQRSQAELSLRRIDSDLELLKVYARRDGIFIYGDNWQSNRKVQVGDNIFPGMEVASIPDLDSMQVIGYVYDTEYRLLNPGMRSEVSFDALPGVTVGGTIVSLTSVATRRGFATDKKLFQAVVKLDKVDTELLKPGMTSRVNVPLVLADGVAAAPREYIGVDNQGRNYVLKGEDIRRADTKFVEVGAIGDRLIEIASGVSVGEKLFPVN